MQQTLEKKRSLLRAGFSLVEIMIVIFIIGLISSILIYNLGGASEKAKLATARQQLKSLAAAINEFEQDTGELPENLQDLITAPAGELGEKWEGPYLKLKKLPKDPWERPYQYQKTPDAENEYELFSNGPKKGKKRRISVWDEK